MSQQQWKHGWWTGYRYGRLRFPPRKFGFIHSWHWHCRHCWWYQLTHPVKIDAGCAAYVVVTVLGTHWFLDFTDETGATI